VLTTAQINGSSLPAKTVVLTYDDGPDDHTLELAHYLADQGVRATFFVNGKRFCKTFDGEGKCTTPQDTRPCTNGQMQAAVTNPKYYPEAWLDEVQSLGHRIANHTQDHCHMPGQNMADAIWEVKTTQDILDRHICDNVYLLRAPFGEWNATVVSRVNSMMGFNKIVGPINWDVDGNDWDCWQKGTSPDACATGYLNILNGRPKKNGIFLMHDRPEFNVGYAGPVLMTKILVPKLKAAGFKFATMDDVLKLTPNPMGSGCPKAPADAGAAADAGGGTGGAGGGTDAGASSGGSSGQDSGSSGSGGSDQTGSGGSASGGSGAGSGGSSGSGGAGSGGSSGSGSGGRASGGSSGGGKGGSGEPSDSQPQDGGGCSTGGGSGSQPAAPLTLLLGFAGVGLARLRRRRR